jgi:hypothetical protein
VIGVILLCFRLVNNSHRINSVDAAFRWCINLVLDLRWLCLFVFKAAVAYCDRRFITLFTSTIVHISQRIHILLCRRSQITSDLLVTVLISLFSILRLENLETR